MLNETAPKDYAVISRKKLQQTLKQAGVFSFGKENQNMLKKDLTIFMGSTRYCKCKNIDEALQIINYYF